MRLTVASSGVRMPPVAVTPELATVKRNERLSCQLAYSPTSDAPLPLGPDVMGGDLSTAPKKVDLLIVGAGLSGAVIAERCSKELGMTSLILDVRDHIGGNCYDYIEGHGIRASKYGAHLFHTKYERVWKYVTRFSEWMANDHRVRISAF